jgi:hypothetical protein
VKAFHSFFVMQVLSSRSSGLREDGKLGNRDTAAGDPPGLRDQVSIPASCRLLSRASQSLHGFWCTKLRAHYLDRLMITSFFCFCTTMYRWPAYLMNGRASVTLQEQVIRRMLPMYHSFNILECLKEMIYLTDSSVF